MCRVGAHGAHGGLVGAAPQCVAFFSSTLSCACICAHTDTDACCPKPFWLKTERLSRGPPKHLRVGLTSPPKRVASELSASGASAPAGRGPIKCAVLVGFVCARVGMFSSGRVASHHLPRLLQGVFAGCAGCGLIHRASSQGALVVTEYSAHWETYSQTWRLTWRWKRQASSAERMAIWLPRRSARILWVGSRGGDRTGGRRGAGSAGGGAPLQVRSRLAARSGRRQHELHWGSGAIRVPGAAWHSK